MSQNSRYKHNKVCLHCGNAYLSRIRTGKYCSPLCSCRARNDLLRNKYGQHYQRVIAEERQSRGLCSYCSTPTSSRTCDQCKEGHCKRNARYRQKQRDEVIAAYGGKCNCCHETEPDFLTIDHIYNDGAYERRVHKLGTDRRLYAWLKRNNFPTDRYQLLCYNCNMGKAIWGQCPHRIPMEEK